MGPLEDSEGGAAEKLVILYIINSLTECTIIFLEVVLKQRENI